MYLDVFGWLSARRQQAPGMPSSPHLHGSKMDACACRERFCTQRPGMSGATVSPNPHDGHTGVRPSPRARHLEVEHFWLVGDALVPPANGAICGGGGVVHFAQPLHHLALQLADGSLGFRTKSVLHANWPALGRASPYMQA